MRSILVTMVLSLSGCSLPYSWGVPLTLPPDTPGAFVATDCLDLRVLPAPSVGANHVALTYEFGNRCDRPVRVDLTQAKVTSDQHPLARHEDPTHPVAHDRGLLDLRAHAHATIGYDAPEGASIHEVCVDLGAVAPNVTAPPTCFPMKAPDPRTVEPVPGLALEWDRDILPPLFVEFGAGKETIAMRGRTLHDGAIGTVSSDALGTISAYTANARMGFGIIGPLYAGTELRVGGGSAGSHELRASPTVTVTGGFLDFAPRIFVGARAPRLGPLRVHGEAFVGARFLHFGIDERYGCKGDGCALLGRTDFPVGGRVGLDVFLSPWWSVGGWTSIDTSDESPAFGFALAFHAHGFDGMR